MPTTYYDGQGFIVRKSLGVKSAKDLTGARVCYGENSTAAQNIKDFFEFWDVDYIPVPLKAGQIPVDFYIDGECDMYGTDRSALASKKSTFSDPDAHVVLPEIISKEPLSPAVKYGDQQFSDIARWAIYVLFLAEELGIDQITIDDFSSHKNPIIQIFMGERGDLGAKLGIKETFAVDIITEIGNYKEIFDMYLGKDTRLGLDRGLNRLYNKGGLLYAPPLK
jgi:general L-amino acid transport system substrate-binding protein